MAKLKVHVEGHQLAVTTYEGKVCGGLGRVGVEGV